MQNPAPILTGRLIGPDRLEVGPRNSWDFADVLMEIVARQGTTPDDSTIELTGTFAGSAPGLELAPDQVAALAVTTASLVISVQALELSLAARQRRARQRGSPGTEVSVSFRVRGDFDPEAFSERVGLVPTSTSRKEEPRRLKARVSTWRRQLGPFAAAAFSSAWTDQLLEDLRPHADHIKTAVRELGLRSAVRFAAVCIDVSPRLHLSAAQIVAIAGLGTALEYSISVPREDERFIEF